MKKEPKKRYPASLFRVGVAMNILRSLLALLLATVLMIAGLPYPWCMTAAVSKSGSRPMAMGSSAGHAGSGTPT